MTENHTTVADLAEIVTGLGERFTFDPEASTGGGCEAAVVTAPDGRTCYLTDGDSCLPFSSDEDAPAWWGVSFGYYDVDDEYDGYHQISWTFEQARFREAIAFVLRMWADGTPMNDEEA